MGASTLWRPQEIFPGWPWPPPSWPAWPGPSSSSGGAHLVPALRWVILVVGVVAAVSIALVPRARAVWPPHRQLRNRSIIAAPAAYSLNTQPLRTAEPFLGRTGRPGRWWIRWWIRRRPVGAADRSPCPRASPSQRHKLPTASPSTADLRRPRRVGGGRRRICGRSARRVRRRVRAGRGGREASGEGPVPAGRRRAAEGSSTVHPR